jgi:hypothetical protein
MQDRELVAAIIAGDLDGLGEAYDRFAAPLYAYCRSLLAGPDEAASAVADTFAVATVKLPELSDPGQLEAWLHAVARQECLRPGSSGAAGELSGEDLAPPAELRERVLDTCGDRTPSGRAQRVSVAHRAGSFGRTGFPAPAGPSGRGWWHRVRRRPRAAAGVAAVALAVALAGTVWAAIGGGPHRAQAEVVALGGGGFGTPGTSSGTAAGRLSPSARPASSSAFLAGPASAASGADSPSARGTSPGSALPAQSSAGSSPSASPSGSPSSSPPPTPGTLRVTPRALALTAVKDKAVSGTFIVTAVGGPVSFTISSGSAKVTVSPASGSLSAAGASETITVTARSLIAVQTRLVVNPGNIAVTVALTINL